MVSGIALSCLGGASLFYLLLRNPSPNKAIDENIDAVATEQTEKETNETTPDHEEQDGRERSVDEILADLDRLLHK